MIVSTGPGKYFARSSLGAPATARSRLQIMVRVGWWGGILSAIALAGACESRSPSDEGEDDPGEDPAGSPSDACEAPSITTPRRARLLAKTEHVAVAVDLLGEPARAPGGMLP